MSIYTVMAATAKALLKSKGQSLKMWVAPPSPYSPSTGSATFAVETFVSVNGVVMDAPFDQAPGTLVAKGDRKLIIDASGGDPSNFDSIEIQGERNSIIKSRAVAPDGTAVIYEVLVRRGQ